MKLPLKLATAALCISLSMSAHSRDIIIGLSPYQNAESAKQQAIDAFKYASQLTPEDSVTFVDAYNLRVIGEFTVPDDPRYKGTKARLAANKPDVAKIIAFTKQAKSGQPGGPTVNQALRLPQILRFIAQNITSDGGHDVVMLGSPFYDDPRDAAFSMANANVPSDGHINNSTAETPYGGAGNTKLLAGMRVHMSYGDENIMVNTAHRNAVHRFWTLYIESMGGQLVYFDADRATLFERLDVNSSSPPHAFTRQDTKKLEMVQHRPVVLQQNTPIYERVLSTNAVSEAQYRGAENVEVGITWDCNTCDIDLYARPKPNADVLSYRNTTSNDGRYWKDYMNSPRLTNGHEIIAFNHPIDLRGMLLAVNFYGGQAPEGVNVEIRISFDGQTFASSYKINASSGDGGANINTMIEREQSNKPTTILIHPLQVLGLAG